jgi:ATP phosphoribosyltransferase
MSTPQLVIGMPAGSLADPNRGGNLVDLLRAAGFPAKGYESGGPTTFPLHSMLVGWDGRPQEFGAQLALGEVDIAIGGADWMRERVLEYKYEYNRDIEIDYIMPLHRGGVRIVIINNPIEDGRDFDAWFSDLLKGKPLIAMVSEMPYLAVDWFMTKIEKLGFKESHGQYSVQKFKTPSRIDKGIVVYEAWGKTEAKVVNGSVDLGMEITQSGSAIRNYGLQISELVMNSESGVYANPAIRKDPEKYELAKMLLLNLYGSIYAENKVLLFFNAKRDDVPAVVDYLGAHSLYGDEPTMNEGPNFTEFSVQLETTRTDLPLAKVRYDLAKLGATAIETVPLDSAIPGLDAIDF